jgi:hypothetical protein
MNLGFMYTRNFGGKIFCEIVSISTLLHQVYEYDKKSTKEPFSNHSKPLSKQIGSGIKSSYFLEFD